MFLICPGVGVLVRCGLHSIINLLCECISAELCSLFAAVFMRPRVSVEVSVLVLKFLSVMLSLSVCVSMENC